MVDVVREMARPRATSERTNSGVLLLGCVAPQHCLDVDTASLLIDRLIVQYVGFSNGDVFHFWSDDTLLSVIQLETLVLLHASVCK
jgi:hypothetical protein